MKLNEEKFSRTKSFNMVNMQNKKLLTMGLKPTIINLISLYVNLQKEIYYIEATDKIYCHKECKLDRDIQNFLELMRRIAKDQQPEKLLENYYLCKSLELTSYKDEHSLTGNDIKKWLNHNANIFLDHICPYETSDAYNKDTLELINTLLETKKEVYSKLYKLFKQATDYEKTINNLLIIMGHYHSSFILEEQIESDSFMYLPDKKDIENSGYAKMFLKAAPDILVRFIGFDKIESQLFQTITTSKPNIYEEFFNEIITGWNIIQLKRVVFDPYSQEFYLTNYNEFINMDKNREYEEEAKWILKNVSYDHRTSYLKY